MKMKKLLKDNKGFTMIELMVVIVIMLILAAIAIPSFNRLINEANESAATSEARTVLMLAQLEAQQMMIDGDDGQAMTEALSADTEMVKDIMTDAGLDEADAALFTFTVEDDGSVALTYKYNGTDKSNVVELPEVAGAEDGE